MTIAGILTHFFIPKFWKNGPRSLKHIEGDQLASEESMGTAYDSAEDTEAGISTADRSEDGVLISTPDASAAAKKRTSRKPSGADGTTARKRRVRKTKEKDTSKIIKYAALFLLVAQMVGLVLLMRYSRTVERPPDQPLYLASTAVFVMEVMKLVICFLVVAYQVGLSKFIGEIYHHTVGSPYELLKLCVPSVLYTVQNNLLYLALTNLDAATYQVCYQLKILTTAVFSAVLLGRQFSPRKWVALLILTAGVAVVQLSGSQDQHATTTAAEDRNRWIGLIAVLCAACTSGFSGVYFGTL